MVSQENAFKTSKHLLPFLYKTLGSINCFYSKVFKITWFEFNETVQYGLWQNACSCYASKKQLLLNIIRTPLSNVNRNRNFGTKLAPYVYTPKTIRYQQKERSKSVSFQNGGQKMNFLFVRKSHVTKILKTTFSRNFFQ